MVIFPFLQEKWRVPTLQHERETRPNDDPSQVEPEIQFAQCDFSFRSPWLLDNEPTENGRTEMDSVDFGGFFVRAIDNRK